MSGHPILVDGQPSGPMVFDMDSPTITRGDGCFEVMRVYEGHPFECDAHLDRLDRSAAMLDLLVPGRADLESWVEQVAACGPDGLIRIILGRGNQPGEEKCVVTWHDVPSRPDTMTLLPVSAPWHSAGRPWDLAGGKTLSYAPNMAATRQAVKEGYDEALLISDDRSVLEGPVFSVAWVYRGMWETPSLDLLILDSITRRVVLEVVAESGVPFREGRFGLDRVLDAEEVMVIGTTREVTPVVAVGTQEYSWGPVTKLLRKAFVRRVRQAIDEA